MKFIGTTLLIFHILLLSFICIYYFFVYFSNLEYNIAVNTEILNH